MNIINYTPHDITVRTSQGDRVFPKSGLVARVEMSVVTYSTDKFGDLPLPLRTVQYGKAELPKKKKDCAYIVSTMFAQAYRDQNKKSKIILLVPDTGPSAIRHDGYIIAVIGLIIK
jgi:hypothetical protein